MGGRVRRAVPATREAEPTPDEGLGADEAATLAGLAPLIVEYKAALAADQAATVRFNVARRTLIDYLKANGLEKIFTL